MPVSDADMVRAWTHVLTLSNLKPGDTVTLLTSANTHPQTLQTARIAARGRDAIPAFGLGLVAGDTAAAFIHARQVGGSARRTALDRLPEHPHRERVVARHALAVGEQASDAARGFRIAPRGRLTCLDVRDKERADAFERGENRHRLRGREARQHDGEPDNQAQTRPHGICSDPAAF